MMRAEPNGIRPVKSLAAAAFGLALALLPLDGAKASAQQEPAQESRRDARAQRPARPRGVNLVRRLNLTPEQRRQLREIRAQADPEARELTRRVRLARRALDEAIYSDAVEEALVEQRTRELAAAQAALMRLRAATELKVRRVLTAEQLQSFRELRRQAARRQQLERRLPGARRRPAPAEDPPLQK